MDALTAVNLTNNSQPDDVEDDTDKSKFYLPVSKAEKKSSKNKCLVFVLCLMLNVL